MEGQKGHGYTLVEWMWEVEWQEAMVRGSEETAGGFGFQILYFEIILNLKKILQEFFNWIYQLTFCHISFTVLSHMYY